MLSLPPAHAIDRENYCKGLETHIWRKPDEAQKEELQGADLYDKQLPHWRALPMWGGVGPGGFGLVMFHNRRKVNQWEWSAAIEKGGLQRALRACRPDRQRGPWAILCDNESFLTAATSRAAHAKLRVKLTHVPARSPDLNPVEMYWSWLRKKLRRMDLEDLNAKRQPIGKAELKRRVMAVVKTRTAKVAAINCFNKLRGKCREVVRRKGAAIAS